MAANREGVMFLRKTALLEASTMTYTKKNWTPAIRKELTLMIEDDNKHDEYTVLVRKDGYIDICVSKLMGDPALI